MRLLRFNISALLVRAPTKLFSSEKAVEGPRKRAFGFLDRVDYQLDVRPQAVEGYPAKCHLAEPASDCFPVRISEAP